MLDFTKHRDRDGVVVTAADDVGDYDDGDDNDDDGDDDDWHGNHNKAYDTDDANGDHYDSSDNEAGDDGPGETTNMRQSLQAMMLDHGSVWMLMFNSDAQ